MSEIENQSIEPIGPIETYGLAPIPEDKPIKPKRIMSQKQLDNLSKARDKAKIKLTEKKTRTTTLKQQERKLRELKLKEREDRIQAELNTIQNTVNIDGDIEEEPIRYVKKPKKKATKIIYYSSSEDESEPEIVYKKKIRKAKIPSIIEADKRVEDAVIDQKYNDEIIRLRRQYIMEQVFPK